MQKLRISLLTALSVLSINILFAQQQVIKNDNILTALVDGQSFETQPRRIKIGAYNWITANTSKPDRSLRFWFAGPNGKEMAPAVGKYFIISEKYTSDKAIENMVKDGKYMGVAVVKWVEETKAPRMEYHVGESLKDGNGILEITSYKGGFVEGNFTVDLDGTYWKERASATLLGGVGRLKDKMVDKAKTNATGFDQDIDPEGNGYKKQDKTDKISITNGTFKLKFE